MTDSTLFSGNSVNGWTVPIHLTRGVGFWHQGADLYVQVPLINGSNQGNVLCYKSSNQGASWSVVAGLSETVNWVSVDAANPIRIVCLRPYTGSYAGYAIGKGDWIYTSSIQTKFADFNLATESIGDYWGRNLENSPNHAQNITPVGRQQYWWNQPSSQTAGEHWLGVALIGEERVMGTWYERLKLRSFWASTPYYSTALVGAGTTQNCYSFGTGAFAASSAPRTTGWKDGAVFSVYFDSGGSGSPYSVQVTTDQDTNTNGASFVTTQPNGGNWLGQNDYMAGCNPRLNATNGYYLLAEANSLNGFGFQTLSVTSGASLPTTVYGSVNRLTSYTASTPTRLFTNWHANGLQTCIFQIGVAGGSFRLITYNGSTWTNDEILAETGVYLYWAETDSDGTWRIIYRDNSGNIKYKDNASTGSTWNESQTDAASSAESSSAATTFGPTVSEAASATESATASGVSNVSQTEAATAAESLSPNLVELGSRAEAATATESQTAEVTKNDSIAEASSATESSSSSAVLGASRAEAATAADVLAPAATFQPTRTEAATAAESSSSSSALVAALVESAAATESQTAEVTKNDSIAEAAAAADAASPILVANAARIEALTSTESSSSIAALVGTISEATSAAETQAGTVSTGSGLNDSGLLVRYWTDEAASGSGPTQLLDSSGNAYHLDIVYDSGRFAWAEDGSGNRYLNSNDAAGAQRAVRAISNTSDLIRDNLDGTATATLELVVDVQTITVQNSRIGLLVNGRAGNNPTIGLASVSSDGTGWKTYWNENQSTAHTLALPTGRVVFHVVYDSTLGTSRKKVYLNGSLIWQDDLGISQDSTLALGTDKDLIVANRESVGTWARSYVGGFYYGALYTDAFTPARVSDHSTILAANDDTPVGGPQTWNESQTDAASAAESSSSTQVSNLALAEAASAAESLSPNKVTAGTVTESATASSLEAGEVIQGAQTWNESQADAASAAESQAASSLFAPSLVESTTPIESSSSSSALVASQAEAATAADVLGPNLVTASSVAEAATATETQDGEVLQGAQTWNESQTDAATAADVLGPNLVKSVPHLANANALDVVAGAVTMHASQAEAATATESSSAVKTTAGAVTESATATAEENGNLTTGPQTWAVSVTEAATALAVLSSTEVSNLALAEAASAAESLSPNKVTAGTVTESATALDVLATVKRLDCFLVEAAAADSIAGNSYIFLLEQAEAASASAESYYQGQPPPSGRDLAARKVEPELELERREYLVKAKRAERWIQ